MWAAESPDQMPGMQGLVGRTHGHSKGWCACLGRQVCVAHCTAQSASEHGMRCSSGPCVIHAACLCGFKGSYVRAVQKPHPGSFTQTTERSGVQLLKLMFNCSDTLTSLLLFGQDTVGFDSAAKLD